MPGRESKEILSKVTDRLVFMSPRISVMKKDVSAEIDLWF